ncbi:MAG: DUF4159 domain-containing protein [Candidatus Methylacidiphilales bacterium]|nr:DUF4159 domain-containing protein [Candidatus Methylacidiphilales bacterium]
MHAPRSSPYLEQLSKSRYLLIATSLHLVLFAMVSSVVIFQAMMPKQDFDGGTVQGEQGEPPPPPPPPQPEEMQPDSSSAAPSGSANTGPTELVAFAGDNAEGPPIAVPTAIGPTFTPSTSPTPSTTPGVGPSSMGMANTSVSKGNSFSFRAAEIRKTIGSWDPEGKARGPIGDTGKSVRAKFVIHVAKYAGGDWNATFELKPDGTIWRGSIPNLLRLAGDWSKGRLVAETVPQPLNLAGDELMEKRPPFVFFHGHKDFVLTDKEVENIRRYLMAGGAVWADSCLAGKGSRFDIAFRREMKRVIPDEDKNFEVVPLNHDLYGGAKAFFDLGETPAGMNFYQEPIEVLKIDGIAAIIYTCNDYSDLMRIPFRPGTKNVDLRQGPDRIGAMPWNFWRNNTTLYRNFNGPAADKAYQVGLNIIVHLLLRFQDKLKTAL